MKVYGQLEVAQLELLAADPAVGVVGRIFLNTTTDEVGLDKDGATIVKLVDRTSTQTIQSKTLTQSTITNSDVDLSTVAASATNRMVVSAATFAALDALPKKQGVIYYATDENKYYGCNGTVLTELGSGSGAFNYLQDEGGGEDISGWTAFANSVAGDTPDDFGGVVSGNFTLTQNTTAPLRGTADLDFAKAASNEQGQGYYVDVTIRNGDLASIQRLIMNYYSSANFATGDVRVGMSFTNDNWVADFVHVPFTSPEIPAATIASYFNAELQTDGTRTQARFWIIVASTSASAYSLNMELELGPRVVQKGAVVYEKDFTLVYDAATTAPTPNLNFSKYSYQRVGRYAHVYIYGEQSSAGTSGSGTYYLDLSDIGVIDEDFLEPGQGASNGVPYLGEGKVNSGGIYEATVTYDDTTGFAVVNLDDIAGGTTGLWSSARAPFGNATVQFSFYLKVPILGWSTNTVMSSDFGSRFVAGDYYDNGGTAITAGVTPVDFSTKRYDTSGIFNGTRITADEPMYLDIKGMIRTNAVYNNDIDFYKNGTQLKRVGVDVGLQNTPFAGEVFLDTNEYVEVRLNGSATLQSNTVVHHISFTKRSRPETLLGGDMVRLDATSGSLANVNDVTVTTIVWDNVTSNTHGWYNSSTGEFTLGERRVLSIAAKVRWGDTSNMARTFIMLYVNGSEVYRGTDEATIASLWLNCHRQFEKGDVITIRAYQDHTGGSSRPFNTFAPNNYLTITSVD